MDTGAAWVLNLDADLELAALGRPYAPSARVLAAMRRWRAVLAEQLLGPGDLLVDERSPRGVAAGRVGRAFCMTPRARRLLERAGARVEPHPSFEVLARVNGRAFCAALGQTLPGALFTRDERQARERLARPPPPGFRAWRVKRAFGMAARGQRVVTLPVSPEDWSFVRAGLAAGVQIEPHADIVEEHALHGKLEPDGTCALGQIVVQLTDARGAWVRSERAAGCAFAADLEVEARRVAAALHAAGYFGPFGVDAFAYRTAGGGRAFNPRSEINARYTMGFVVGFGSP